MQRLSLSTADQAAKDRFAYWREDVNEALIGVTGESPIPADTPFTARVDAHLGLALAHFRYRSDGFPVSRGRRQIAQRGWDNWIWLYQECGAGAWFSHGGREHLTNAGDLVLVDPAVPFATKAHDVYDLNIWLLPRHALAPHLPGARFPRSWRLPGTHGIGAVLAGYLDSFAAQLDHLPENEVSAIAGNVGRLVALACGGRDGDATEALRAARLDEARRYIDLHLSDPALTPEKLAGALKISVRQLHGLFVPTGISVARYVQQRRLEECRAALREPRWRNRSITDIAFAWGFNSLATFYRAFRQAYGMTPSEWRAAAESRQ
jgi:AraC-like DNA-binding protein